MTAVPPVTYQNEEVVLLVQLLPIESITASEKNFYSCLHYSQKGKGG